MKILVIGHNGQVAQALGRIDGQNGVTITCLGRPTCDLTDHASIGLALKAQSPDIVVNAAAYTAVDKAESDAAAARALNAEGPTALATQCKERSLPLIHISTDYVYDGSNTQPHCETGEVGPTSVYGKTKLEGERGVASANPDHLILRTAWVFGADGANFVKTMLRVAAEREELNVVGDQHGNPTAASDIADAIVVVAKRMVDEPANTDLRGIFNFAGKGDTTWAGFAQSIFKISKANEGPHTKVTAVTSAEYPTPAVRPKNSRLNIEKFEKTFGEVPTWNYVLQQTVIQLVEQ